MRAKATAFLFASMMAFNLGHTQTIEFFDDFESGLDGWDLEAPWGISDNYAYSPGNSLSDSPAGNYANSADVTATVGQVFDLSDVGDAIVSFYLVLDMEIVYDILYLEASHNGGDAWQLIKSFNGEDMTEWEYHSFSLYNYLGDEEVMVRLRFISDGIVSEDGVYIDDFLITTYDTDVSGPVITHTPFYLFEGSLAAAELSAKIQDATDVTTEVVYQVDGAAYMFTPGEDAPGDFYDYTIPPQEPGAWVDYYFSATDEAIPANTSESNIYSYISGFHVVQDNGSNDAVLSVGADAPSDTKKCAVKFTFEDPQNLLGAVIHMTTLYDPDPEPVMVHVWDGAGGIPGDDMIPPFMVTPECSATDPFKATRVDFRPYADQLTGITGDYFIGYDAPEGSALIIYSDDFFTFTIAEESYRYTGSWSHFPGSDFHIRAVTNGDLQAPVADFSYEADDLTVAFEDISDHYPTTWLWDFGDGETSTEQNPVHTFDAGNYTVCLTASNVIGTDSLCRNISATLATVDELPLGNLTLFPNPATEIIYVTCSDFSSLNGDEMIIMSDVTGKQLYISQILNDQSVIPLKEIPAGIYRITVINQHGILLTQSFMKQ